ncbi:MAG: hypothetical protein EOO80_08075 [Oxalobacteraceae bacterium]|nr:MAG: hypothetical protein EOO80_08075 [Oxalobacteraceae bacterium]
MKKLLIPLASAALLLSGCIAVPYNAGAGYHRSYDREPYSAPSRHYRDRDRDGVPNRYDRAPANPYRY